MYHVIMYALLSIILRSLVYLAAKALVWAAWVYQKFTEENIMERSVVNKSQ